MSRGTLVRCGLLTLAAACADGGAVGRGDVAPDFALEDLNPASPTFGEAIGPSYFRGEASAWYFGHSN
jgi:hypothetical protein